MPTATIGDNTGDDYSGTEDCNMEESSPTTNQNANDLDVSKYGSGDWHHSLIRFTGLSNIPSSATVSAATIYVRIASTSGSDNTANARRVLRAWTEAGVTWNTYDGSNNWGTAGGTNNSDRDNSNATSGTLTNTVGTWDTFASAQMIAEVEDFIDGTLTNDGHHFERTDGSDDSHFKTITRSEGTDGSRPYISVTYTSGAVAKSAAGAMIMSASLARKLSAKRQVSGAI